MRRTILADDSKPADPNETLHDCLMIQIKTY